MNPSQAEKYRETLTYIQDLNAKYLLEKLIDDALELTERIEKIEEHQGIGQ
jgi:hypothetical protein